MLTGDEGGGRGRGAKSYDSESLSSINHSIFSGCQLRSLGKTLVKCYRLYEGVIYSTEIKKNYIIVLHKVVAKRTSYTVHMLKKQMLSYRTLLSIF